MTLVEVITVIGILIIIMVAVSAFQYNVLNYNRSAAVQLTNVQEAQALMKIMVRELRSMEPSVHGAYPITTAGTSSISFFSNIDSDPLVEQVHYYLSGSDLYKATIKPSGSPLQYIWSDEQLKIIATGLSVSSTTPLFDYFTGQYDGTTASMSYPLNLTIIRLVQINLRIDTDPNKSPIVRTFSSRVSLRNLKDNL